MTASRIEVVCRFGAFDAEWAASGALCVDALRIAHITEEPSCLAGQDLSVLRTNRYAEIKAHRFGRSGTALILSEYGRLGR